MNVKDTIEARRAYRSIDPVEISDILTRDLTEAASLAPSCFNYQPWRFVFVTGTRVLEHIRTVLSRGNEWAHSASLIAAVFSRKEDDCTSGGRDYYLFDTGMATAFLILRATELGLVAHPIAGFNEAKVKEILDIPDEMTVITLLVIGKHSERPNPILSEKQLEGEKKRPARHPLEKIMFVDRFVPAEGTQEIRI